MTKILLYFTPDGFTKKLVLGEDCSPRLSNYVKTYYKTFDYVPEHEGQKRYGTISIRFTYVGLKEHKLNISYDIKDLRYAKEIIDVYTALTESL